MKHDNSNGLHDDGKRQQGNSWHDYGDGRHNDSKGQDGAMKIAWAGTADGMRRRVASMRGRRACMTAA